VDYARSVGLEVILPAFGGGVPGVFVEKHREARYVDVKWGEAAAVAHLYPTDPLFAQVGAAFVRAFIETYGTDHVYNIDAYPETRPGASEVEQRAIKTDFARGVWAYLQAADPEAVWYMSGWTFLDAGYWPPEAVRDFFAQIPPGRAYVCDIWADANPIYRRLDYFFGHDWGFSVLHSFGGDDQLHGRFADLIARVKDVAADPRANRCVAYYINPEFVQGNPLYFELAAQLGWNPRGITVNRYLQTVARRRYGAAAAPAMVRCLRVLAESVYGPTPGQEPRYQRRIADLVVHPVDVLNTGQTIPALVEALALARKAVENGRRAVPLAAPNDRLYERDVLDLARQLIDELFNQTLLRTQAAFRTGDRAEFDRRAAQLRTLLEAQARLLAARDDFCLAPDLAKVKRQPGDPAALERTIRDPMYTFAGTPWLRDYPSRDRAELVQFYYRPRVEAYLDALSDSLVAGKTVVDTEALNARYDQIEAAWLDLPIAVADRPRSVIAALHEVWPLVEPIALERPTFAGGMARPGDRVGWREDFRDVTQWHETYSGGIFASDGEVATLTSETKWCLVGTDLDVSLSDFPVLSFRCRCDPGARGAAWLWATWVDAAGHEVRSLVWNQGTHTDWTEVSLDLEAILSLIGDPVTLRRLEINNQDPPHVSRWDWLQLSSRG
jgi:alpha-N-acetylglucosaminidase